MVATSGGVFRLADSGQFRERKLVRYHPTLSELLTAASEVAKQVARLTRKGADLATLRPVLATFGVKFGNPGRNFGNPMW